jgi:hypothetical protein
MTQCQDPPAFRPRKIMKKPPTKPQPKLDLGKLHAADYAATRTPALVTLKPATYLAIAGQGEPGGAVFTDRIGALYGVAFTVKMTRKFAGLQDYAVGKLECVWPMAADGDYFSRTPRQEWEWKLLIRTPDFVGANDLKRAVSALLDKGKPPSVREVRLETIAEGQCVQMLHVGPYDQEGETIQVMAAFAQRQGLKFQGRHHEIFVSDPRRVAPAKLKTILRHPVVKADPAG